MKEIFILEPFEGEQYEQKVFSDKESLLMYLDSVFKEEDGDQILKGYNIVFNALFDACDMYEAIKNHESSCVPAMSYFRANRVMYECDRCHTEFLDTESKIITDVEQGIEYDTCPFCGCSYFERKH